MITLEQIEEQAITALENKHKELGDKHALYAACPSIAEAIVKPLMLGDYLQLYADNQDDLHIAMEDFIRNNGLVTLSEWVRQEDVKQNVTMVKLALQFHLTRMLEMESVG
jgi:hypothetical protein